MNAVRLLLCAPGLLAAVFSAQTQETPSGLAWDHVFERFDSRRGETQATFVFQFANSGAAEIVVHSLKPSCDCTVARMPGPLPWRIAPGETGQMNVQVDLRERREPFDQVISVQTSLGTNEIRLQIHPPEPTPRERNQWAAFADRQAVFKGDCAKCHWQPAKGKGVAAQYALWCGICHEAENRAEMVPALGHGKEAKDKTFWDRWIRRGKPGTLMPAFEKRYGGPLAEWEIIALTAYVTGRFRGE